MHGNPSAEAIGTAVNTALTGGTLPADIGSAVSLANANDIAEALFGPAPATQRSRDMLGQTSVVQPRNILAGVWTYGIPGHLWRVSTSGGGDGTAATVDGALRLASGTVDGGIVRIESKDHPRYIPDQMWGAGTASPALPIGSAVTIRIGQFTTWSGIYIEVDCSGSGTATLKTRRTTGIVAPSPEDHTSGLGAASTATASTALSIPAGVVLSKATLYDILALWRGVADQQVLFDLVQAGTTDRLGVASNLWTGQPALPFAIEVERHTPGANATVDFGCAFVKSWGEPADGFDYRPLESGNVTLDNTERPLIVVQAAGFLGGQPCLRDHICDHIDSIQVDAAATVRVYRNATPSNANVTWSIPDATRGLVLGIGSNTATLTTTGAELIVSRTMAANAIATFEAPLLRSLRLRPVPGTLTTGANRGNPSYGETLVISIQKSVAGAVVASATPVIGSLY